MYLEKAMKNKKTSGEWCTLGILFGVTFGIIFDKLAIGIILGLLVGLVIENLSDS